MLRPLQRDFLKKMASLRDGFIARAESSLGRKIEYESMGPSFFKAIDLRRVRLVESDGSLLLSVERLRFEYSLRDLLSGKGALAVRGLVVDRPSIRFDAVRDADLADLLGRLSSSPASGGSAASVLAPSARVRVRGGSFRTENGADFLSAENVSVDLNSRDGRLYYEVRSSVEYRGSLLPEPFSFVRTSFRVEGDASPDLSRLSCTVSFPRLETNALAVSNQALAVSYDGETVDVRKTRDRQPFDLRLRWKNAERAGSLLIALEAFAPGRAVAALGPWASYSPWLDTSLSGRAEIDFSARGAAYRVDLRCVSSAAAPLPSASLDLAAEGDLRGIAVKKASLSIAAGSFSFEGSIGFDPLKPEGMLSVEGFRIAENAALNGDFRVSTEGRSIALFSDSFYVGALRLDALDVQLRPEAQNIAFSASALRFEDPTGTEDFGDVRLGKIAIEGSYSFEETFLQASATLDSFSGSDILTSLQSVLARSPPPPAVRSIAERIALTTEVFVTTNFADVSFNIPRLVVAFRGDADAFAVMSVSGTKGSVAVRDARVFWKGGSASGALSVDFADAADIAFKLQALYRDTNYSLDGALLDGRNLSFRGEHGLAGNVAISDSLGISGAFSVESLPVPVLDYRFLASVGLSFRYAASDAWSAEVRRLAVEEPGDAQRRPVRVSLEATADQNGAAIGAIAVEDAVGPLSGDAKLDWRGGFRNLSASARLADSLGDERYEAELRLEGEDVAVRAYAAGLRSERISDKLKKTRATGEVRGRWRSLTDYEADFKIAELKTEVEGKEYKASGSCRFTPDLVDFENVALAMREGIVTVSRLSVERPSATARMDFSFKGFFAGHETETSFGATASFGAFADWTKAAAALSSVSARFSVERMRYGTISMDPFDLAFSKEGTSFSLSGGPQNAVRLRFDQGGAFFAALSAPSPIRLNIVGTLASGMIDARASGVYIDFPALWSLLDIPDVRFTGGIATGALAVSGPLSDPDFFGSATASGFRALVPAWVDGEIGPVSADVAFDGKEFTFGPAPVSVKKGSGTLSGRFHFDRWVPIIFSLLIDIPKESPIPVKADVSGIVARGFSSGSLEIANSADGLRVSGRLGVQNTTMTIDADALAAAASAGQQFTPIDVSVDLTLVTGKKVEFVWPSSDLPVLRGYADSGDSLGIVFDGSTGRYTLQGDIDLRGGEVFYFMRSFYLRSGSIKFNENQLRMDPRLALLAEIRDRNDEGPVTVSLVVDEAPLSSFRPRFESSPPLSQAEIFGLLGQNLLSQDSAGGTAQMTESFITATSDALAQFNVVRVFERNVRDFTGLDMFSVRTQLIQNAFFNATGLFETPVDRNVGLGNYFDNTTVYMGKFLGSDVFLQGLISVRVDEAKSANLLGGLTLEPEFGVEWKTPLFMLRWNFTPNGDDLDKLFINDHSFTITWRKAF